MISISFDWHSPSGAIIRYTAPKHWGRIPGLWYTGGTQSSCVIIGHLSTQQRILISVCMGTSGPVASFPTSVATPEGTGIILLLLSALQLGILFKSVFECRQNLSIWWDITSMIVVTWQKGEYPGMSNLITQALYKVGIFSGWWWKRESEIAVMRRTQCRQPWGAEWSLADSQQGNKELRPTTAKKWILPTTWISSGAESS